MKTLVKQPSGTGENTKNVCTPEWLDYLAPMEDLQFDPPAAVHFSPTIADSKRKHTTPIAFEKING